MQPTKDKIILDSDEKILSELSSPLLTTSSLARDTASFTDMELIPIPNRAEITGELRIVGQAIEFLTFPVACAMYLVRKRSGIVEGISPPPPPPWRKKNGLLNFGLSSVVLGLGIAFVAASGVAVPIGLALASITLARGLWSLGTTMYALRKQQKREKEIRTKRVEYTQQLLPAEEIEKNIKPLEAELIVIQKKINYLSTRKHYLDIAEKALGAGIAALALSGAALALFNPVTAPIVAAVALAAGIGLSVYKLAKFAREKYLSYKNKKNLTTMVPAEAKPDVQPEVQSTAEPTAQSKIDSSDDISLLEKTLLHPNQNGGSEKEHGFKIAISTIKEAKSKVGLSCPKEDEGEGESTIPKSYT